MPIKDHWDALIAAGSSTVAAILAFFASMFAYKAGKKVDKVEVSVNGKMEQLIESARKLSHAEGRQDERDIQEKRRDVKDAKL